MDRRCVWNISPADEGLKMEAPDKRCCGSGVCIINEVGECWCGQVWDGEKMTMPSFNLQSTINENQEQDLNKLKPDS